VLEFVEEAFWKEDCKSVLEFVEDAFPKEVCLFSTLEVELELMDLLVLDFLSEVLDFISRALDCKSEVLEFVEEAFSKGGCLSSNLEAPVLVDFFFCFFLQTCFSCFSLWIFYLLCHSSLLSHYHSPPRHSPKIVLSLLAEY